MTKDPRIEFIPEAQEYVYYPTSVAEFNEILPSLDALLNAPWGIYAPVTTTTEWSIDRHNPLYLSYQRTAVCIDVEVEVTIDIEKTTGQIKASVLYEDDHNTDVAVFDIINHTVENLTVEHRIDDLPSQPIAPSPFFVFVAGACIELSDEVLLT